MVSVMLYPCILCVVLLMYLFVGRVSVFWLRWYRWGVGMGLGQGSGGVGWCYVCVYGRSRYLYIVLGGYLRILGAHSVQFCCTLWISAS